VQRLDEVRNRYATELSLDGLAAYHTALDFLGVFVVGETT
jgi:hypothetical protein